MNKQKDGLSLIEYELKSKYCNHIIKVLDDMK